MPAAWFKPMSVGSGAVPASWRGWAALCAYVAAVAGMAFVAFDGVRPVPIAVVFYIGSITALTAGFIVFALTQAKRFKAQDAR
jgi:hypothetical protein